MRYLVIGLGIYGSNLARDLTSMGHEVIGADNNSSSIEAVKEYISTVYLVDSSDESALSVLPLKNVDLVIVAIGENFGASVKTVALLKQFGVKHIYARAIDPLHYSILECFELDRILTPEQRAASDLALEMVLGSDVVTMNVDKDTIIAKFKAPKYFEGVAYSQLKLNDYNVTLVAACRPTEKNSILGIKSKEPEIIDISDSNVYVTKGDVFTCLATRKAFKEMMRHIS
jgi:trk system potassium uptake protein TrkA